MIEELSYAKQHWRAELEVAPDGRARLRLNDLEFWLERCSREAGVVRFTRLGVEQVWRCHVFGGRVHVGRHGESFSFEFGQGRAMDETRAGSLSCRMPGKVVALLVDPGAQVKQGQALLVLEAMKMEHEILAPADGVLAAFLVEAGGRVMPGQLLADFVPAD